MISPKEFYNRFNRNSPYNKNRHKGALDARLFLRDMSHPFAYNLAKAHVSANFVTLVMFCVMLVANFIFIFNGNLSILFLVSLHEFAQMLDCVDGQLARYYGSTSDLGLILDESIHAVVGSSFLLAFGVRLFLQSQNPLYILLGGLGSIGYILDIKWLEISAKQEESTSATNTQFSLANLIKKTLTVFDNIPLIGTILLISNLMIVSPNIAKLHQIVFITAISYSFAKLTYRFNFLLNYTKVKKRNNWKGWS